MSDSVFAEIAEERQRQKNLGYSRAHDEFLGPNDWVAHVTTYAGQASSSDCNIEAGELFRKNMLKVAALAVAAIESYDELSFAEDDVCGGDCAFVEGDCPVHDDLDDRS